MKKLNPNQSFYYVFPPSDFQGTRDGEKIQGACYLLPFEFYPTDGLKFFRYIIKDGKKCLCVSDVTDEDLHEYFYEIVFTNMDFVKQIGIDESFFVEKFFANDTQMSNTERIFLYNFVQKIKPQKIMEFSCAWGYSTLNIAKALIDSNIKPHFFETHEIDKERIIKAKELFEKNNINFVNFKEGDVFETLDKDKLKEVDFLFIDSDHEFAFANRYIVEFLPLLKKGTWVGIHDIRVHNNFLNGETICVEKYIRESGIKEYFHIVDLLKEFKLTVKLNTFEHCARNSLFFFKV